ncbi:MAG TPA: hypothetical protein VGH62_10460 [Bradyrhizobium sp.]|jgi:hypothetical protein
MKKSKPHKEVPPMLALVCTISVVLGGTTACLAERFPAYTPAMETVAGVLLIGGLALIGSGLPVLI